ncbi:HBR425Cp [Eremothecium sinecaudum]|uniref:HBR425Cp n=1 Tax=Eremothecium sinecaudum TaxID=45286 RepID=A0A109UVJ3_9SACH|nr:HBR425Cp [Eremothecium sinecaudum]AMD19326.1 HBR425Cp [Eremothecium sinecaudum]
MLQFKLVLLGDSSVGKSSIVHRFVKDSFDEFRESTIGAAFLSRTIKLADYDDVMIKFEIWDTAGQERYKSLAPMYYRNANAALVVYDVTQEDSLIKAQSWVNELKSKVGDDDLVICLVGNKVDIAETTPKMKVIDEDEARAYADEHGLIFHEVSAKTGKGVLEVFYDIGKRLYLQRRDSLAAQSQQANNIQLQRPTTNDATSCCS